MNNDKNYYQAANESTSPEALFELNEVETPTFPIATLGVLAGPAEAIVEHIQVPGGMAGMSLLTAAALVAQAHVDVEIDGRRFPCSLFGMTVAESGDRKSQTDSIAMRAHRDWEEQASRERGRRLQAEKTAKAYWHSQVEDLKSSATDAQQLQDNIQLLGPEPRLTLEPTLTVSAPTFEGLLKAYRNGIPYKGLFSDEGGTFFGGYAMRQEGAKATIAGLSKLWDGAPIQKTNAAEGESYALWGRRLSAHLMVQPVIARGVLGSELLNEQGFLPRFLLTWPKSLKGERFYRGTNPSEDPRLHVYWSRMTDLLSRPVLITEEGQLELRVLTLDKEARQAWIAAYNAIERELGAHGELVDIAAYGSKAAEIAARIAGVLAFTENPECTEIALRHVECGVAVIRHSLDTLMAVRARTRVNPQLLEAEQLRNWLLERTKDYPQGVITKTEVAWYFRPKLSAKVLDERMSLLAAKGWLRPIPGGAEYGGKTVKQAWQVRQAA